MEYEVRHNGMKVGTLKVGTEGLMTVFEARTRRLEGVQRLWAAGEDKSAYLGVLMPAGNEMCLRKKLSRRDMMEFPKKILFASTSEGTPVPCQPQQPKQPAEPAVQETVDKTPREQNGIVWRTSTMGTLVAVYEGVVYTAIPAMLRRAVPGIRMETIDGRKYIIFRRGY